jgi:hypothetical protein
MADQISNQRQGQGTTRLGPAEANYRALLDAFRASERSPSECVRHLVSQGFTTGQARNAVYRYRRANAGKQV